jgi:hypothetical protein
MKANTTGFSNVGIGENALKINQAGAGNVAVGYNSLQLTNGGNYNTAVGWYARSAVSGANNSMALGYDALATNTNYINIGNTSIIWIGGQVGWSTYSDARMKHDVQSDIPGLAFISKLNPVSYFMNIDEERNLLGVAPDTNNWTGKYDVENIRFSGFLAQEVQAAAQSIGYDFSGVDVPKGETGMYSLRYSDFVVPLVKAVQELNAKNEEFQNKNVVLENKIDAILQALSTAGINVPGVE